MEKKKILEMKNIDKSFSGNSVLKNVYFEMEEGEIHALIGANGAGKSTLVKILNGIYNADNGEIWINGERADIRHADDAEKYGIAFVHQELNICPDLTVAENVFVGNLICGKFGSYTAKKTIQKTQELIDMIQVDMKATDIVRNLRAAEKQIIEILKALTRNAKILVLDEPTSSLNEKEKELFFGIVNRLKTQGVTMLFISHFLEDILAISDRVSVIKDGTNNGVFNTAAVDKDKLIYAMMGESVIEREKEPKNNGENNSTVLELKNLSSSNKFSNINMQFKKGSVVGICGLLGAGKTEIARSIFGLDEFDSGSIYLNGEEIKNINPEKMMLNKVVFLSEDRKVDGFVPLLSIRENITMSIMKDLSNKIGVIKRKKQNDISENLSNRISVKMSSVSQSVGSLSGGNQQKVIIGRCIATKPNVFILDEPTRGVDVFAKAQIYNLLTEMADNGVCIIIFSSELEELLGVCDEIIVLKKGEVQCSVDPSNTDKTELLALIS